VSSWIYVAEDGDGELVAAKSGPITQQRGVDGIPSTLVAGHHLRPDRVGGGVEALGLGGPESPVTEGSRS
jgi:hypothetical protein